MSQDADSRFDAEVVLACKALSKQRRFEMRFADSAGTTHVVSLPLPVAVAFVTLICDVTAVAPFTMGERPRTKKKPAKPTRPLMRNPPDSGGE